MNFIWEMKIDNFDEANNMVAKVNVGDICVELMYGQYGDNSISYEFYILEDGAEYGTTTDGRDYDYWDGFDSFQNMSAEEIRNLDPEYLKSESEKMITTYIKKHHISRYAEKETIVW